MDRIVTNTRKDAQGDILCLCGPWGKDSRETAINNIYYNICRYYVSDPVYGIVYIKVVDNRYLRTERDCTTGNNLDELPNC